MQNTPGFSPDATHCSGRRLVAHMVDGVLQVLLLIVVILPFSAAPDVVFTTVGLLALTVGGTAYYVVLQRKDGRTPGKRLAGIRVVNAEGETPNTRALIKRTVPLMLEYLLVVALIGMLGSTYRQRLGDRWAKTYVVIA